MGTFASARRLQYRKTTCATWASQVLSGFHLVDYHLFFAERAYLDVGPVRIRSGIPCLWLHAHANHDSQMAEALHVVACDSGHKTAKGLQFTPWRSITVGNVPSHVVR